MTLNHVHLGTLDLESSVNFYCKYFAFRKSSDHGQGAFLKDAAGFLIAIDPVEKLPTLPDWYHLGFCLSNEAEVLEKYEVMKKEGVNIARDLKASKGEYASFFVKDPSGNKLEVSWHAE